jgi:hypothetical protein
MPIRNAQTSETIASAVSSRQWSESIEMQFGLMQPVTGLGGAIAVDPPLQLGHYFETRGHPIVGYGGLELPRLGPSRCGGPTFGPILTPANLPMIPVLRRVRPGSRRIPPHLRPRCQAPTLPLATCSSDSLPRNGPRPLRKQALRYFCQGHDVVGSQPAQSAQGRCQIHRGS